MTTQWSGPPPVQGPPTAVPPRRRRRRRLVIVLVVVVVLLVAGAVALIQRFQGGPRPGDFTYLRGINVYTLENVRQLPESDIHGEPASTYTYLAARGLQTIRLAVPWQQLQPVNTDGDVDAALDKPLDTAYVKVVKDEVAKIEDAGLFPILDLHNGCGYPEGPGNKPDNQVYCGGKLSTEHAVHIWEMLSDVFKNDDRIAAYDLFNEPTIGEVDPGAYKQVTQQVVDALRKRGDEHVLWVEAMRKESIRTLAPDGPWIHDPADKIVYSAHFYPGYNAGPEYQFGTASRHNGFLAAIDDFGRWCTDGKVRCSIGEIGWPGDQASPKPDHTDQSDWNALGNQAYDIADLYGMDVTYFGTSSNSVSTLWAYGAQLPGDTPRSVQLDHATGVKVAFSQAAVIQAHLSRKRTPDQQP